MMEKLFLFVFLVAQFYVTRIDGQPSLPTYPNTYNITGAIRLPYAEILEPFTAYYDGKTGRSRVDYYGGVQKVIQVSKTSDNPYGMAMKIIPYSTQSFLNKISCFAAAGSKDAPTDITTVLPDLSGFMYSGDSIIQGIDVHLFKKVATNFKRSSTYTFAASKANGRPVRYEMMGYDSLLGSHYDKYYVDYFSMTSPVTFKDSVFAAPEGMTCSDYPGPGLNSASHKVRKEPIREFVHGEEEHLSEEFEAFVTKHQKKYEEGEQVSRMHIFRQNLRHISSKNRAGLTFTLAVNHLADKTQTEMKALRGYRYTAGDRGGQKFSLEQMPTTNIPDQMDWRLQGAVTPVKDQAICGSCWSFGTTGAIEGANFLKTGKLVRLSQQELVDCAWAFGNNGCDGGEDFRAYQYMLTDNQGLTSEEQYGQYLGIDSFCRKKEVTPVVQISNYTLVTPKDLTALKIAIFNKGPISVAIDASNLSFSFYSNGVYYEPACHNDADGLDHAVLAVGYGVLDGQAYWLVKNSWSTYWGNDGYVLMSQKDNNCGVATAPSYVEIK